MKKIAITGVGKEDRMILVQTLSYLTGYDVVRQTAYSSQAFKYGLKTNIKDCNWQELFVYVFSSFSERIEIEQQYDMFISNGSVFNELANMDSLFKNHSFNKETEIWKLMYAGLEKIISEYAIRTYDCIIHIDLEDEKEGQSMNSCNDSIKRLVNQCEKKYCIHKKSFLTDIINQVSVDMNLSPVISTETALERAKREILK